MAQGGGGMGYGGRPVYGQNNYQQGGLPNGAWTANMNRMGRGVNPYGGMMQNPNAPPYTGGPGGGDPPWVFGKGPTPPPTNPNYPQTGGLTPAPMGSAALRFGGGGGGMTTGQGMDRLPQMPQPSGIPNAGSLNLGFRGMPGGMGAPGGMTTGQGMQPSPEFSINSPGKIGYQNAGPQTMNRDAFGGSMLYQSSAPQMPPQDFSNMNKGPVNIYGGGQPGQFGGPGYTPGSGWQQMLDIYSQQRNANMQQPAQFGRYPDGTPIADPSINFRRNALQGRFGGGWDY